VKRRCRRRKTGGRSGRKQNTNNGCPGSLVYDDVSAPALFFSSFFLSRTLSLSSVGPCFPARPQAGLWRYSAWLPIGCHDSVLRELLSVWARLETT